MIRFSLNVVVVVVCLATLCDAFTFTSLDIDNHPCKPENLKHTKRYICDNKGNIICQAGWREPEIHEPLHTLNPCLEPICDVDGVGGCVNGECRAPNFCACEVGWEGAKCDQCVPLPGCDHGTCSNAFDCNCFDGWEGAYCDIANCTDCVHGTCSQPNECVCLDGWTGVNCDECQPMPGCVNGVCDGHPHTCKCLPGWEGHLCDQPICSPACVHGFCHSTHINGTLINMCICNSGWRDEACDKCSPYWDCPNQKYDACDHPNECFCHGNENDPELLCNNTLLTRNNHPELGSPLDARAVKKPSFLNGPVLKQHQRDFEAQKDLPLVLLTNEDDVVSL